MDLIDSLEFNAARKSNLDADKELLTKAAAEIHRLKTALRRIAHLGDKNVIKYAQEIAREVLAK